MPFVQVNVVGSLNPSISSQIMRGISSVLQEVANKSPAVTYIQCIESSPNSWGRGEEVLAFQPLAFPCVEIKSAGPLTFDQKEAIVAGVQSVLDVHSADSNPPPYIVIQEISRQSWGRGGSMLERPEETK